MVPKKKVSFVAIFPTMLTLGNLICGLVAIYKCAKPNPDVASAAIYIFVGMIFDGVDGFVARKTKSASRFGTELDSICDMITFGISPAVLLWTIGQGTRVDIIARYSAVSGIFFASCVAVRLARFNVETDTDISHHISFDGLPSPGAAGVAASFVLAAGSVFQSNISIPQISLFFSSMSLLLGLLMVSRIRYAHMLNKMLRRFTSLGMVVEFLLIVLLFSMWGEVEVALFVAFSGYALTGPASYAFMKIFRRKEKEMGAIRKA